MTRLMLSAVVNFQAATRNCREPKKKKKMQQQQRTKAKTLQHAGTSAPGIPLLH